MSTCSVTSLDWIPNSERHFVYGTSNGTVRLCDADERKVVTEMSASRDNGAGQSVQQVLYEQTQTSFSPSKVYLLFHDKKILCHIKVIFIFQLACSPNSSVIAISTSTSGDSNSEGKTFQHKIEVSLFNISEKLGNFLATFPYLIFVFKC